MSVKVPTTTQWQDLANKVNGKNTWIGVAYSPSNTTTFTLDIPMWKGKSTGFIHNFVVFCYVNNAPTGYVCAWTKDGTHSTVCMTNNTTTLTFTHNSVNETNGTVNITLTFSKTVYGGIRVLAIV